MTVKLHKTQHEVASDTHRFRVICAGRRWGKSTLAQLIVLKWAVEKPGLYWIVSPTYKQSKQIHWRGLQEVVPREWVGKKNEVELSLTLKNGAVIQLIGAENPDALRGVKLRGLVIDEIASVRNWEWLWSEVLRPTLTDYAAPALFISTPKGFNHFYDLYLQGQKDDINYKSWSFTSYDNPYIPKGEIDAAKKELTEDTFYQEYMADFRKYTGLVYKEFDRFTHVKELADFVPVLWLRGCDRGFRNPSAVPIIGVDKDGVWYQSHELYAPGLTTPELAEGINSISEGVREFELSTMDSANASDIAQLNDLGLDFVPVRKQAGEGNKNYVRYKIQKFAERLKQGGDGRPGYYVSPSCVETIREFEVYAWPERVDDTKSEEENPLKVNDHMMDALSDLNAMYLHYYQEKKINPWDGKIPGTYITPSPVQPGDDEYNDFTTELKDNYWTVDL